MSQHKNRIKETATLIGEWRQVIRPRKDHQCYGCLRTIPKSEHERDLRGVHFAAFCKDANGKTGEIKMCARCMLLELLKDGGHKGFVRGEFKPETMASAHKRHWEEVCLRYEEEGLDVLAQMNEILNGKKQDDVLTKGVKG